MTTDVESSIQNDGFMNTNNSKYFPPPRKFSKKAVDRLSISKHRQQIGAQKHGQYVPRRELTVHLPWGSHGAKGSSPISNIGCSSTNFTEATRYGGYAGKGMGGRAGGVGAEEFGIREM